MTETTRLSDIIDIEVFEGLDPVDSPEKTQFTESGVVVSSPLLDNAANGSGKTVDMPYWNDLDASIEPNYSDDDPAKQGKTDKVVQDELSARKAFLNNGWQAANLAREIAMGDDAIDHIRAKVDKYWSINLQKRLLAACAGIMADNIVNNDGDMINDVAAEAIADQTSATMFSRENFTRAAFTLGDHVDVIRALGVHSHVKEQMVNQDQVEDHFDKDGNLMFSTYMGKRLIVDDSMPVIAGGTDGFKYTTILFGDGAFGFGEGSPIDPYALAKNESAGNGAGIETFWARKTWLLHPAGYQQTGTPSNVTFTLAELAAADVWSRRFDRKLVPMAFLVTN